MTELTTERAGKITKLTFDVVEKLMNKFALNFTISVQEGYIANLMSDLVYYNFSKKEFEEAWQTIYYNNTVMYNAMPNIAMFNEVRPKKEHTSYDWMPKLEAPVENKITDEQRQEMVSKLEQLRKKLSVK